MRMLIAVPCMDMMHTQFVHSLLTLKLTEEYEVRFGASSLIYDTRNQLIKYAIEKGFERVMWLDSDMKFDNNLLKYLNEDLDNGYDIVSGLYFARKRPYMPIVFKKIGYTQHEDGLIIPEHEQYYDYPENSLFEIAACGFGCVMMKISAVKDIVEKYGNGLFTPITGFGEDISFCLRARSVGKKIWCDSRAKCGHVGEMVFDEDYWKGYKNGTDR